MKYRNLTLTITALLALLLVQSASALTTGKIRISPERLTGDSIKVWIYFTDKGGGEAPLAKKAAINAKALQRRLTRGTIANYDFYDRHVNPSYIELIRPLVKRLGQESRWLNAVSAWVSPDELSRIGEFGFVGKITQVAVFYRPPEPPTGELAKPSSPYPPDYGKSFTQEQMIEVNQLHDRGLTGNGITILMLDTGFKLSHPVFEHLKVDATYDFINGDTNVEDGPDVQQSHGTSTLSEIGGYDLGQMIGVAYSAHFLLAKTEVITSETMQEEDNWVAGIEWGEGLGADVVSSSLGYIDWYTWEDMDGNTAACTVAADLAAAHGLMVVNSVGNEGHLSSRPPSMVAPADGDSVIAVGAVDMYGILADFSSDGPTADGRIKPDVCAMGVADWIAVYTGGYSSGGGTSFAAPLVAGAVALLLEAHPGWRYGDIYQALTQTATQSATPDNLYGYGIVKAYQALSFEADTSKAVAGVIAAPNPFTSTVDFLFSLKSSGDVTYRVYDVAGEKVAERTTTMSAGESVVSRLYWDGTNFSGRSVTAGVYIVYFTAPGLETTLKIFKKE